MNRVALSVRRRPRVGGALIVVLGVLALLSVVISTFVTMAKVSGDAAIARNYSVRMDLVGQGVLQQVRMTLARDLEAGQENFDHPRWDPWLASVLPDNGRWTYISRPDLADQGRAGTGRPQDNIPAVAPQPIAGSGPWYVDTDGDGIQDSMLLPAGDDSQFPDRVRAYVAIRIVDSAGLNATQHMKWEGGTEAYPPGGTSNGLVAFRPEPGAKGKDKDKDKNNGNGDLEADPATGFVDWRPNRPRLPQVNLRGLRNYAQIVGAQSDDNPDGAGELDYDFDRGFDTWLGSDTPRLAAEDLTPPPFTLEDDLAARSFGGNTAASKYEMLWPNTMGRSDDPALAAVRNRMRTALSSVSRTRTVSWMQGADFAPAGPRELHSRFDLRKLPMGTPAEVVARLDTLFVWMKGRGILQTDDKRAQFLVNLYEYMRPSANPEPPPMVYAGPAGLTPPITPKTGMTRQPFLTEILREGDQGNFSAKGPRKFGGRFGVELHNPYDRVLDLEPYVLRLESVPFGQLMAGAILRPRIDVTFPAGTVVQPGQNYWTATDNNADFQLPSECLEIGPRVLISLIRNTTISGVPTEVVVDRFDSVAASANGKSLDWRDWDLSDNPAKQAQYVAAANNGWVSLNGKLKSADGVRSGVYRPQGAPGTPEAQYAAYMTGEWLGYPGVSRNSSNLRAPGQPVGTAGVANPGQTPGLFGPPARAADGNPFIFGFPVPISGRGGLLNLGELAQIPVVAPPTDKTLPEFLAAASAQARTGNYGPGNSWAWLNPERAMRFDIYDPAPDPQGRPYANARLLDLVSVYLTASGNGGPFEPVKVAEPASEILDDSSDDAGDANGDGKLRPGYREGLININTAPQVVLQNLVFPRRHRTGDRVTTGLNVEFAKALRAHLGAGGNSFENLSDAFLWAKVRDPALPAVAWDLGVEAGRQPGQVNDMFERDRLWGANSNVLTTRSDVFTVYICIKLLRSTGGSAVEDLGEARFVAVLDRTICNPVASARLRRTILPRVLAQQFYE